MSVIAICGILCLSIIACQPLEVPAEDSGSSGSETTLPADSPAEDSAAADMEQDGEGNSEASAETDSGNESGAEGQGDGAMLELTEIEQKLVDLAQADLSSEFGIAPDQIKATSMQAVDFADSSLGCPEEGMMYAQVITPGYQFMLEADGTTYEYHGTGQADGRVVRCNK